MKIKMTTEQDVPNSLYCNRRWGLCGRAVKLDGYNSRTCSVFDRILQTDSCLRTIKCEECAKTLRKTLEEK